MTMTIETLKNEIKSDEEALALKETLLKAALAEEKRQTPFSRSFSGGLFYRMTKLVTSPIANLHNGANRQLAEPYQVRSEELLAQSNKLCTKAEKLDREKNPKKANKVAIRLAKHVCEVDDFIAHSPEFADVHSLQLKAMRSEVERLRAPRDEKKLQETMEQIQQGLDGATAAV